MADKSSARNQVKEITDRLEQGVKDIFTSEKYMAYLQTMSRFHRYSTRNTLLIHMQKPDATLVAGYQAWQNKFGRYVKKGERGLKILAPMPFLVKEERQKLDPDSRRPILGEDGLPVMEEVERRFARFKVTSVFDVSQTDGKPLPSLAEDIAGDVRHYELFMDALRAVSPLPIGFEPLDPEKDGDGLCRMGNNIAIRQGMSEIQTVSAVIHEITHAKLHDIEVMRQLDENAKPKDRRTEEVEAESVSYAVCQYYGIETAANSFGYIADWSKNRELKELNASLDTIRKTAAELIDGIDEQYRALAKERGIDLTPVPEQAASEPAVTPAKESEAPPAVAQNSPQSDLEPNQHVETIGGVEFVFTTLGPAAQKPEKQYDTSNITVSATQDTPVFSTPAQTAEQVQATTEHDPDDIFPDPAIGLSERDLYGYTDPTMLPLLQERALELFDADHTIYMLYDDNTEAMVFDREEIITFASMNEGIFGIAAGDWEQTTEYKRMAAEQSEGTREAMLLYGEKNAFGIYQLKGGDELRYHRWASLEELVRDDLTLDRANYELVYTGPLDIRDKQTNLHAIYKTFNGAGERPSDFTGHSISKSDVIVLQWRGEVTSHYVNGGWNFKELLSFLGNEAQSELASQEQPTYFQVGNTLEPPTPEPAGPTVSELEAEVKAGRQISLTDLARAVKNERQGAVHKGRPSLLAQLQEYKNSAAQGADSPKTAPKHDAVREV